MSLKLNLGCADTKRSDYINIDNDPQWLPDIRRDLARGLPFGDNIVEEVYAKNVLEHLSPDDLVFVMQEIYRVLKPDGIAEIIVPLGVVPDWSHKSFFHLHTFENMMSQRNRYGIVFGVKEKNTKTYGLPFDYTEMHLVLEKQK